MKAFLRISMVAAIALLGLSEYSLFAQEELLEVQLQRIQELEDRGAYEDIEIRGRIEIDGNQIQLDGKKIEAWLEANAGELEEWAEKHAESWEEWADQFGEKMEHWAEDHEAQWEDWAKNYSQRWEEWGAKLEAGQLDHDDMGILIERNLEMLKEMPLDTLIEGALHQGLGELKNAPFESLGELHELIGGALEQSLRNMEIEIAGATKSERKKKLSDLKTDDLQAALAKLQYAIAAKQRKLAHDGSSRLAEVEILLEKGDLTAETKADILAVLKRELAEVNVYEKRMATEQAKNAQSRAKEMRKLEMMMAKQAHAKAITMQKTAKAKLSEHLKSKQLDMLAARKDLELTKETLDRHYTELKKQEAQLGSRDSEIEAMRREIKKLRREVERMKKQNRKKDD